MHGQHEGHDHAHVATADPSHPGAAGSGRWKALALLCLAQFMVVLDVTVVNVALPSIGADLGLGRAGLTWVIAGYTLAFGGLMVLGGRTADRVGRRRTFVAGLVVFTAASLVAGLAWSPAALVGARVAQGVGAALLSPSALSIITTTFHGRDRHRALGVWAAIGGTGAAVGVLVGGLLTDGPGWRWAFFVNVPVGLFVLVALLAAVSVDAGPRSAGRLDVPGALTATAAIGLLVYGLVRAGDGSWAAPGVVVPLVAAAVLAVAFVLIERSVREPLIPAGLVVRSAVPGAVVVMLAATALLIAGFFVTTFLLQGALHASPVRTGLAFLPVAAGTVVGAHLASRGVTAVGPQTTGFTGFAVAALGFWWLAQVGVDSEILTGIVPGFVLAAVGLGATFVSATTSAMATVDPQHAGVASGMVNTGHEIGASLGVALVSAVVGSGLGTMDGAGGDGPSGLADVVESFARGYGAAAWFAGVAALAVVVLLPRGRLPVSDGPAFAH